MATSPEIRVRIEAFARQLSEEVAEVDPSLGDCWLDAIENEAVAIGDAVQAELVKLRTKSRVPDAEEATCPECGQGGRWQGERERLLIGRRGPVNITEPEYFCPCCRKAFFPSDPSAGH
jgi:hypothetical protein